MKQEDNSSKFDNAETDTGSSDELEAIHKRKARTSGFKTRVGAGLLVRHESLTLSDDATM